MWTVLCQVVKKKQKGEKGSKMKDTEILDWKSGEYGFFKFIFPKLTYVQLY